MTINEAIKHCEEVMMENLEKTKDRNASDPIAINCFECADEHRQLAEWLKDYKRLLEQELNTAHWEETRYRNYDPLSCETYDDGIGFRCSSCSNVFKVTSLARYHYCPNCGTKMESEVSE